MFGRVEMAGEVEKFDKAVEMGEVGDFGGELRRRGRCGPGC
jgi:hypothetical protein